MQAAFSPLQYVPLLWPSKSRVSTLCPITTLRASHTYPCLLSCPVPLPQFLVPICSLLCQIRILLHFGLVQPVDYGILPLLNIYPLDLLVVLESDLAGCHTAIFFQVRPGRVDYRDVVFFVACTSSVSSSLLSRAHSGISLTLDGIGFCQLGAVFQELLRNRLPRFTLAHSKVDVRTRQVVYVKLKLVRSRSPSRGILLIRTLSLHKHIAHEYMT